jgi:transcription antitermination factor NusG
MSFWCCVRTRPQREAYASERIQAAGFDTFVRQQWRVLNTTFGVLAVVRTGDCPCRMPDAEIEALNSMIDEHGYVRLPEAPPPPPRRKIAIGAKVRITAGPFGGWTGLYDGQSTKDREKILLNLLGSQRSVEIASNWIAPA